MPSLRTIVIVIVLAAVAYGGWTVNGWRNEAARAQALAAQLLAETKKRVALEATRLDLQRRLDERREQVGEKVKTITKTIIRYVGENPECDLPDAVASQLQRLREGNVSNTSP